MADRRNTAVWSNVGSPLDDQVEPDCAPHDSMDVVNIHDMNFSGILSTPPKFSTAFSDVGEDLVTGQTVLSGTYDSGLGSESYTSICRDFKQLTMQDTYTNSYSDDFKGALSTAKEAFDSGYDSVTRSSGFSDFQNQKVCDDITPEQAELYIQDEDGDTQLHMAIIQLLTQVATYIISKAPSCASLNVMNDLRQTPLHLSVITNQPEVTSYLMTSGAGLEYRDNKGNTALHIACKEGYLECVQVLTTPISSDQVTYYPVPLRNIPQDLEISNYEGQTCLQLAADNYLRPQPKPVYLQIIHHLLMMGANINKPDGKSGRTILHYSAEYGNLELLDVILRHGGADLNAKTYAGKTAVMLAHGRGFDYMEKLLVQHGAELPPGGLDDRDSSDEDSCSEYDDIHIGGQPLTSKS